MTGSRLAWDRWRQICGSLALSANLGYSYPQRTGDTRVRRGSDFTTSRSPVSEYEELLGFRAIEMLVPLPVPVDDALDHRVLLFRDEGPDFTGRDVLLMELLRPHIVEMHASSGSTGGAAARPAGVGDPAPGRLRVHQPAGCDSSSTL